MYLVAAKCTSNFLLSIIVSWNADEESDCFLRWKTFPKFLRPSMRLTEDTVLQEIWSLENIIAAIIFSRKFCRRALLFFRKYYRCQKSVSFFHPCCTIVNEYVTTWSLCKGDKLYQEEMALAKLVFQVSWLAKSVLSGWCADMLLPYIPIHFKNRANHFSEVKHSYNIPKLFV